MADEIVQVLGFDCSDAIDNLDRLGNSISNVSGRLTRFGKNLERFNSHFGGTASNLMKSGDAADRFSGSLSRMESRVGRLTTSVELLSRIVYTQLVIKGLRIAEMSLTDAAKRAADLELKFADIATISGKTFNGIRDIGSAVEQLSRNLGTDQLAVAEGLYEAIGNQIGGTKQELIDFNRVAGEFATATLTDQQDSIRLLSGVLNSYAIDVSRAEEVASKFNKAIDLGSITGRDFASQFGRVAPQAALLGVSLDEVLAAFATLTRNGLSASESATRLLGVITGLQKPSEKLSEALNRLNASSGEGLVRSVGFANALKEIAAQTDGSSAEIAKLFPNVRGLAGELILGSQRAEAFASDLKGIQETASSLNKERFNIVFETDTKKVERELNELRIEATKLGAALVHLTANAFEFVGGADNIIQAARIGAPAILGLATATGIFAANARLAVLNGTRLGTVLGKFGTLGLLTGGAVSLGNLIGSQIDSSRLTGFRQIEAANQKTVEKFIEGEQTRLQTARNTDSEIVRSALDASREQIAAFNASSANLITDEKRLVTVASSQLNRFITVREGFARQLERAAVDSSNAIEQSQRRVTDLRFGQDQRNFDFRLSGLDDPTKFSRTLTRSAELARKAASDLTRARTGDEISAALRLFDAAERTGEGAQHLAQRLNDRSKENRAVSQLNRLTRDRIRAEQQLQTIQERRAALAASEAEQQRQVTDEVKASSKLLIENLPTVGLDPSEQARRASARRDALSRLTEAGFSQADFRLSDALGLARLATEMERNPLPIAFDTESAVRRLETEAQAILNRFKLSVNFDVSGLEKALGRTFQSPDDVSAGLAQATTEADALRTALSKIEADRVRATSGVGAEIRELLNSTDTLTNTASRAAGSFLGISPADVERGIGLIREFRGEAERLAQTTNVTRADVDQLFAKVREINTIQSGSIVDGAGFKPDIEALSTVTEKLRRIANLPAVDPQQAARLQQLESIINSSRVAAITIENSLTRGASQIEGALNRGADRLERALNGTNLSPQNFATGGLTRGSDTVPAMLSPGEVVMNRNASQRFFSDLQRMNAGMVPQYRNAGGNVTTVGDTVINVNGAKSPELTASAIESMLVRRQRLNLSRLR